MSASGPKRTSHLSVISLYLQHRALSKDGAQKGNNGVFAKLSLPTANWLLDQIGVQGGWRAVDIGCGPIGILNLLSQRVGQKGAVIGLEREQRFVEMALARRTCPLSGQSRHGYLRDTCLLSRSLLGAKRTCPFALHMSASDPKRTSELKNKSIRNPLSALFRYSFELIS